MIELRWKVWENVGAQYLEYRFITPNVDASGGFCPPGEWSEWLPVPSIVMPASEFHKGSAP